MKLGLRISEEELDFFINSLCRVELEQELEDIKKGKILGNSRYLKAVRVTLHALGFDPSWIEGRFRDVLERTYGVKVFPSNALPEQIKFMELVCDNCHFLYDHNLSESDIDIICSCCEIKKTVEDHFCEVHIRED